MLLKRIGSLLLSLILSLTSLCYAGVDFDGTDDWLGDAGLDLTTGNYLVVAFWIKGTTDANSVYFHHDNSGQDEWLIIGSTTLGSGRFVCYDYSDDSFDAYIQVTNWTHIIVMIDKTYTDAKGFHGYVYANGSLVTNLYGNAGYENPGWGNSGWRTYLATRGSAFARFFDGAITEVYIWDNLLTAGERAVLYSSRVKGVGLQIQPSNLQLYWPLNDLAEGTSGDGATFKDLSGNGYDATGDDGGNNTGLTAKAEEVLSYPSPVLGP